MKLAVMFGAGGQCQDQKRVINTVSVKFIVKAQGLSLGSGLQGMSRYKSKVKLITLKTKTILRLSSHFRQNSLLYKD